MILESLELESIGPFRERMALGPFVPGLNILAQRNEWGKSTVLKALTRAFFDKYSAQSAEIRGLQPKGSSLSPQIGVVFSANGERWQLRKGFLDRKASELSRWGRTAWERTDESDKADQRVRDLIGAPKLEGRTVRPESWGLLRYLWAPQDDAPAWPEWSDAAGHEARRRLATVDLDPAVTAVVAKLEARVGALLTGTAKTKANGALDAAEKKVAQLTADLAQLTAQRAKTDALQQSYVHLLAEVAVLEKESAGLAAEAARLKTEAAGAEKLQEEIGLLQTAHEQAELALGRVSADRAAHEKLQRDAVEVAEKMAQSLAEGTRLNASLPALETALAEAQNRVQSAREARQRDERNLERIRALLRLRAAVEKAQALQVQAEKVAAEEGVLHGLEAQRAALPTVSSGRLKAWRELDRTIRENAAQLDALGLRVTLIAEVATQVTATIEGAAVVQPLAPGRAETLKAPQAITLELPGWGKIEIRSGAREISELQESQRAAESRLRAEMAEAGLATLAAAESAVQQAAELDQRAKSARAALGLLLGSHADSASLRSACARAQGVAGEQRQIVEPTAVESAQSVSALQAEEESQAARLRSSASLGDQLVAAVEEVRARLESARRAGAAALSRVNTLEAEGQGLLSSQAILTGRYSGDLPAALALAQGEFIRAEARVAEARRQLPVHAEKLPERSLRAARAAGEAQSEWAAKAASLLTQETLLRERGGEGLYSQIAAVEEKLDLAQSALSRTREEAWALRVAADLIRHREQSAIQTVLAPLEYRLSGVLADLTGERGRSVFFDQHLAVRGVGRHAEELVPFEDLSRGTREQLLLALRAAIALEVAKDAPTCLILDDVLVHTDPVRQQNVLDYLRLLAQDVQIVILTCHAERYRGEGHFLVASR